MRYTTTNQGLKLAGVAAVLLAVLSTAGCHRKQIVHAAPPSVNSAPPQPDTPVARPPVAPPRVETKAEEPPPEMPAPAPPAVPLRRNPPRPRPVQAEAADPAAKPAPPQISPQLSPQQLARAKQSTTANITNAEKNLQIANGKQLNAAQKDLTEKISGFLGQSHEAILADDWVRAQNLAEKAQVLSVELVKSF